jgi:ketosteroid isomerase-like protein
MSEADLDLVREFNQLFVTRDLDALNRLVAPDYVAHNGDREVRGREGWRGFLEENWSQFDRVETGIDELFSDGSLIAERWWFRATAKEGGQGLRGHGITVHRVANGRLQENWGIFKPEE